MPRGFRITGVATSVDARTARRMAVAAGNLRLCLKQTVFCLPWTHSPPVIDAEIYQSQLDALKADLAEALADVERHEAEIKGTIKQVSRLALDPLEEGLTDALRQVEEMKKQGR